MPCVPGSRQWALSPCAITDLLVASVRSALMSSSMPMAPRVAW